MSGVLAKDRSESPVGYVVQAIKIYTEAVRIYGMHLRYRATNEMLESRPVYYTQRVSADANAASVLTDQYTYRASAAGPSTLNIMD